MIQLVFMKAKGPAAPGQGAFRFGAEPKKEVMAPGSRGGKFYRTEASNKVAYGEKPTAASKPSLMKLEDGREFPQHGGKPLAWNIGAHNTPNDASEGNPRTKAVIAAMHHHRPDQLKKERDDLQRGSFDKVFGGSAKRLLGLIDSTVAEQGGGASKPDVSLKYAHEEPYADQIKRKLLQNPTGGLEDEVTANLHTLATQLRQGGKQSGGLYMAVAAELQKRQAADRARGKPAGRTSSPARIEAGKRGTQRAGQAILDESRFVGVTEKPTAQDLESLGEATFMRHGYDRPMAPAQDPELDKVLHFFNGHQETLSALDSWKRGYDRAKHASPEHMENERKLAEMRVEMDRHQAQRQAQMAPGSIGRIRNSSQPLYDKATEDRARLDAGLSPLSQSEYDTLVAEGPRALNPLYSNAMDTYHAQRQAKMAAEAPRATVTDVTPEGYGPSLPKHLTIEAARAAFGAMNQRHAETKMAELRAGKKVLADDRLMEDLEKMPEWKRLSSVPNPNRIGIHDQYLVSLSPERQTGRDIGMSEDNPFADAPVISGYTRAQAIEDGDLWDVTEWASHDKGFHGGFTTPVAMTTGVHSLVTNIPRGSSDDARGRAHDILYMASLGLKKELKSTNGRIPADGAMATFKVKIGRKIHTLWAKIDGGDNGEPVTTIMRPEDY